MKQLEIKHNEVLARFEADLGGEKALIAYIKGPDGTFNVNHTEAPGGLAVNKEVTSELVKQTLEQIKTAGAKIIPSCGFITNFIKHHPNTNL